MGVIKTQICSKLGIPVCNIELSGWELDKPPGDNVILESLCLPRENILYLSEKGNERDAVDDE